MESEYVYPIISDRSSPKEWNENNKPEIIKSAHDEVNDILENHKPIHISNETDKLIREKFKIYFSLNLSAQKHLKRENLGNVNPILPKIFEL